jgi:hypothetical protein
VAALFTPDGEAWDKEGNEAEGREAIARTFADIFATLRRRGHEMGSKLSARLRPPVGSRGRASITEGLGFLAHGLNR